MAGKTIHDAVCLACGCLCDDIELALVENRIVAAKRACVLGKPWFLAERNHVGPACLVDGTPAAMDTAFRRAAELLVAANSPLVVGLVDQTCQAQRAAVAIADRIGGCVDASTGPGGIAASMAMQTVGKVSATLGEVANRSDLVIFWRTDPAQSHPRHFVRYSLLRRGMFTPGGRRDRTCVVVDSRPTKTSQAADRFLKFHPGRDLEVLWTLRAMVQGVDVNAQAILRDTGVPLKQWQALADMMQGVKYGAIFYEPDNQASLATETARLAGLFSLTRELNAHARFVALANLGAGNLRGAENVLAWRTGYSGPIDFGVGYPRYGAEYSAESVLSRGLADAALVVGERAAAGLSATARWRLQSIPRIVLADADSELARAAAVVFHIATDGIHSGGTVFRMDGVPLPLRPVLTTSRPSAQTVLEQIETQIRALVETH